MISIVMLFKNNQEYIADTLEKLKGFNEVVLIDTGSSDETTAIAQTFSNVKIYKKKLEGFGSLRNEGAALASNDWILALDTDEVLSNELVKELMGLSFSNNAVYEIPFKNYYKGKWIKACGWYPESHVRLYNKRYTSFSSDDVHEKVLINNIQKVSLNNFIHHTSYRKVQDFLVKMDRYSTLFAKQNVGKKKSSLAKAIFHALFAFFKSYFIKKGFIMGKEGFIISTYNANTAFYKYLKLAEANRKDRCC
ncbi:MAG: glycosyltransferase family 2 protein [Chlamydiota bacterium]|jgi:glycosyltransferase involved in cell wall biosynthesis